MDFLGLIYALFIGPLELFFEVLYAIAYRFIGNPGLSIVFLSLGMNFLVLPLYRRADAMQEAERERATKMKPWTDHIKKTFKGDERFMMLQTYNRQCGYKPTDALKGSVSLLLEIPFFIAAYHFLSNLKMLQGVSFGPIVDLGAPDALLTLGTVSINVLPILMTAINLVSAIVYMKGLPLQNKIQMYGIAAIFLVLLYNSPAGLVFYWTLNNVFSLVKNIFYRMKNPELVLCVLASVVGISLLVICLFVHPMSTTVKQVFVIGVSLVLQLPLLLRFVKTKREVVLPIPEATQVTTRAFFFSALFLAILTGALIPSTVILASPTEFVNITDFESPLWYVAYSLAIALGTFVVWFGVFYWLATPRGKSLFGCLMLVGAGIAVVDYLFFGASLGNLSSALQYENNLVLSFQTVALNFLAIVFVAVPLVALWLFKDKGAMVACASLCVAALVMSGMNVVGINQGLESTLGTISSSSDDKTPYVTLSTEGKNVIVIMMDRAIGYYLPYLVNENPELKEKLQGFTYYPNAVSYGIFTNVGVPGLYGGYDYTPENMNARDELSLAEKHDEALKVLPTIFSDAGYDVTFFDPTYAGYSTVPNLSAFDDMPEVETYISMDGTWDTREGLHSDIATGLDSQVKRNFFCYSLFRIVPVVLQPAVYNNGKYNSTSSLTSYKQVTSGASKSQGIDPSFMSSYSVLQNLPSMTRIEKSDDDVLFIMSNDTTHAPTVLKEPEYIPALEIDNTDFDGAHRQRYAADGSYISFSEESGGKESSPTMHYEINMAALRELCNWFDYLRDSGVWDNTRIIVVSDHGRGLKHFEDLIANIEENGESRSQDLLMANCLLMVKDFDSEEFLVDERFMTNADTPTLATEGLIDNPVNPFTGNPIDSLQKEQGEQHILFSYDWNIAKNNGNTFVPGYWFSVHDDIYERGNWEYLGMY